MKRTFKLEKEKKLLKIAQEGKGIAKRNAIRQILHENKNLVSFISKGYSSFGGRNTREDLEAEGNISLLKAIEKFESIMQNEMRLLKVSIGINATRFRVPIFFDRYYVQVDPNLSGTWNDADMQALKSMQTSPELDRRFCIAPMMDWGDLPLFSATYRPSYRRYIVPVEKSATKKPTGPYAHSRLAAAAVRINLADA